MSQESQGARALLQEFVGQAGERKCAVLPSSEVAGKPTKKQGNF